MNNSVVNFNQTPQIHFLFEVPLNIVDVRTLPKEITLAMTVKKFNILSELASLIALRVFEYSHL